MFLSLGPNSPAHMYPVLMSDAPKFMTLQISGVEGGLCLSRCPAERL
jgi:hypothetical protein